MEAKPYSEEKRGILIERNAKDFVTFLEEITDKTGKQFIREKLLQSQVPGFRKGHAPLTRTVPMLISRLKKERKFTNSVIWDMFQTAWTAWVESHRELNKLLLEFDNSSDFDENRQCVAPSNSELDIECFKTLLEASRNNQIDRETIRRFYDYGYFLPSDEIETLIEKALPQAEIKRQQQLAVLPDQVNQLSETINSLDSRISEIASTDKTAQKLDQQITEVTKSFESQLSKIKLNFNKRISQLINSRLTKVEESVISLATQLSAAEFNINDMELKIAQLDQRFQKHVESIEVRLDGMDRAIIEIKIEEEQQHQMTHAPRIAHQSVQIGKHYAVKLEAEEEHYNDENEDYLDSFAYCLRRFGVTDSKETANAIHVALKAFPALEVADTRIIDVWRLMCDNHLYVTEIDVEMGWLGLQDWFPQLFSQECFGEQLRQMDLDISVRRMLEIGNMPWAIHLNNCDRSFPDSYLPQFLKWINDFSEGAIKVFLTRYSGMNRCETNEDVYTWVTRLPEPQQNREPIESLKLKPSGVIVTKSEWESWCRPGADANPQHNSQLTFLDPLCTKIKDTGLQVPTVLFRDIQRYLQLSHHDILAPSRALDWALTLRLLPWIENRRDLIEIVQNLIDDENRELPHFRDGLLQASEEDE